MVHYYIKNCYIKNRTAFVISVLGCIEREIYKDNKRNNSAEVLDGLTLITRTLMTILRVEKDTDTILSMYDCLEATEYGAFYSEVQENADKVSKFIEDDITIHFTGPFGETTDEYLQWLPDFNGKIKILFE